MTRLVAITGATGFAGRHAVAELIRRGHQLRALVRNPGAAGLPDGVEMVAGGLSDPGALQRLVTGADAVVHLEHLALVGSQVGGGALEGGQNGVRVGLEERRRGVGPARDHGARAVLPTPLTMPAP